MRNLNSPSENGNQDANKNKKLLHSLKTATAIIGSSIIGLTAQACGSPDGHGKTEAEKTARIQQALVSDGFQAPVKLNAAINTSLTQAYPFVRDIGGGNLMMYYAEYDPLKNYEQKWVKLSKADPTVVIEGPGAVSGLSSNLEDSHLEIYNGEAYAITGIDNISAKLNKCSIDATGKNVTSCIPENGLNSDAVSMGAFTINQSTGDIYGVSDGGQETIYRIANNNAYPLNNCGDGIHPLVLSYAGNGIIAYGINQGGGNKITYQPLNAQGTDCLDKSIPANAAKLIDSAPGSANIQVNGKNDSGGYLTDNGIILGSDRDGNFDLFYAAYKQVTQVCGNSAKEGTEQCDDGPANTNTLCVAPYNGTCTYCDLSCATHTVIGPKCNDGIKNGTEACDTTTTETCASLGYQPGGSVACKTDCTLDTTNCVPLADGGTGGSAGTGGTGPDAGDAGGSAGTGPDAGGAGGSAGEAGLGGAAGSAGLGGSAGEAEKGGSAGTGGLGGSAGEAGSAGTGGIAGSAGEGGGAGTGGTAGSGGSGPDCFAKVDNTANFDVTNCTADTVEANVKAPVKIEIAGKTIDCFEGQGTIKYVLPNVLKTSTGLECEKSEDPNDPNKLINTELGWTFGFEGTRFRPSIPAELNPQKAQGKYVIAMVETKEGQDRLYTECDSKNINQCTVANNAESKLDNGAMPAGTVLYLDLVNHTATVDRSKLTQTPPVTQETGDGGGCSVCSIKTPGEGQDSTRNALLVMGLLAAGAMARRRR